MNPAAVPANPPVATPFFFYLLAAVMIIGGILVITRKNAVHSAMALITTLSGAGGAVSDALRSIRRWRADHSLRGRHHGAVPVRDHADLD